MFLIKLKVFTVSEDTKMMYFRNDSTSLLLLRKDEVIILNKPKKFSSHFITYKGKSYEVDESMHYFIKNNGHCFKRKK